MVSGKVAPEFGALSSLVGEGEQAQEDSKQLN